MKRIIRLDAIAEVGGGRDAFALYDMPGFADAAMAMRRRGGGSWYGNQSHADGARMLRDGDLSAVPAADKIMGELDGQIFLSRQFRTVDDVVGAVPNVPAFIAGIPQNMRRRMRTVTASAPLAIFADLTTSAGIDAADVRKRGVAILALVQLLSNFRPVEAWAMIGLGAERRAHYVAVRLDTAPLDLARAAHVLTSTMVARGIGYGLVHEVLGSSDGDWPYANVDKQRKHGAAIFKRVANPGSDVLFIPPAHVQDALIKTPVAWIKDMLAQYGGVEQEAA